MCPLTSRRFPTAIEALETRRLFATGLVVENLPGRESLNDTELQPDGKVLVLGMTMPESGIPFGQEHFFLARHLPDGTPDPTFGQGGKVITNYDARFATEMALAPDGSILVLGPAGDLANDLAILRFRPDGSLDTAFGTGGTALFDWGGDTRFFAQDLTVLPDGRFAASGSVSTRSTAPLPPGTDDIHSHQEAAIVRFTPAGQPDPTFDADGRVVAAFGAIGSAGGAAALQPDGKLVVAVGIFRPPESGRLDPMSVARFNPNGSLDVGFGRGGLASVAIPDRDAFSTDVLVQPDGKIVLLGAAQAFPARGASAPLPDVDAALVRLNPNGAPDPTFGDGDGITVNDYGGHAIASRLNPGPNGSLYVTGRLRRLEGITERNEVLVARFDASGHPDAAFGANGRASAGFPGIQLRRDSTVGGAVAQPDGKLVIGGTVADNAVLTRYNPDGTIDTTFGQDTLNVPVVPEPPFTIQPPVPTLPLPIPPSLSAPRGRRGALQIRGTPNDDTITISEEAGGGRVRVVVNGASSVLDTTRVRRLVVRGLAGNDQIVVDASVPLPTLLRGGGGNDRLVSGGAGNDLVFGGVGNDTVLGGAGRDTLLGGAGTDTLEATDPDDVVNQVEILPG
jgi:uncharacterized delta-60 repeat protein